MRQLELEEAKPPQARHNEAAKLKRRTSHERMEQQPMQASVTQWKQNCTEAIRLKHETDASADLIHTYML